MIVVDAGVVATALGDDGPDGDRCRLRLRDEMLAAPELIDLEVVSVYRRMTAAGRMDERRAALALRDLVDLPLERAPHAPLVERSWQLRQNLTAYDAAYVALAEVTGTTLVTADGRLARSPGLRCEVELVG